MHGAWRASSAFVPAPAACKRWSSHCRRALCAHIPRQGARRYSGVDDVIALSDGSLVFTDYAIDRHDDRLPAAQLPYNV